MGLQLSTDHDTRQTDIKPIPIGIQVKKEKNLIRVRLALATIRRMILQLVIFIYLAWLQSLIVLKTTRNYKTDKIIVSLRAIILTFNLQQLMEKILLK